MTLLLDQPHHDGSALYVASREIELGSTVGLRLRVPTRWSAATVHVRCVIDGEPEFTQATIERVEDGETWWSVSVVVSNPTVPYRFLLQGDRAGYRWVNWRGVHSHDVADRDDFRLTTSPPAPAWLSDAVVYQIMPDRFARGPRAAERPLPDWAIAGEWDDPIPADWRDAVHQVYGGDLDGIVEHLDHITALGANTLYLTPVFPARSSHRYDAETFDAVDSLLGGDEALAALTAAAHDRGVRVIGDLTTNHSGDQHRWFRSAERDDSSTEAEFYIRDESGDDFVRWFGVQTLPKFDLRSDELRRRLVAGPSSVVARWLQPPYSLDGWRIDVANMTGRHGETDVNRGVARDVRATVADVRPDGWVVAEHCHDATADLAGDGWHGTMAYSWFTRPVWCWLRGGSDLLHELLGVPGRLPRLGGCDVVAAMRELSGGIPWSSFTASMTLLDSHDTARFRAVVQDLARQIVGVAMLMTYPGVPSVFAGDEIGVDGASTDQARKPFPWDEAQWDRELITAYRELVALRRDSDGLRHGGLRWASVGDDALTYLRESAEETVVVHVARAPHEPVELPAALLGLPGAIPASFGSTALAQRGDVVALPAIGPAAHVWRIPRTTSTRGAVL